MKKKIFYFHSICDELNQKYYPYQFLPLEFNYRHSLAMFFPFEFDVLANVWIARREENK